MDPQATALHGERKVRSLNAMLQGVRRVNRLITRERSPDALMRRSVEILVETRGLASATILLKDPFGFRAGASAGSPAATARFAALVVGGNPPPCVLRAAAGEAVLVRDPSSDCVGCPASADAAAGHEAICVPVACEGRHFGVLHVVLPPGIESGVDEVALLGELASDVAFALRSIELESQVDRTQKSLWAIDERFNALVAASPTAIVTFDADGAVTSWNHGAETLFGWSVTEALGPTGPFGPKEAEEARALLARVLAGDIAFPLEETRARKDGRPVDVSLSPIALRSPEGTPRGLMCLFEDVSARRAAERALRESEERFRTEFEYAAAGRSISSPDGRIILVNRSLAGMLGVAPEALIGRYVEELIHPDDREWSREAGLRLLAGEASSFRCEIRFLTSDCSPLWVDLNTALYRDATGKPVHFIAGANDLTARKRAEEESQRRGARLESLAEVARALAAAHTVEGIAAIVPRAARALVDADGANVFVQEGEELREAAEDAMGPLWKTPRAQARESACRWALAQGAQAAIEDVFDDPRLPRDEYGPTFVRSLVATPVGRTDARAAISVYWTERHVADPRELVLLQALADSTSVALENVAAYDRLRRSEERYRHLIESLDDLVFAVDVEGRLTYVSGAVSRYRFTPEEVLGHRFQEFAHPDDRGPVALAFAERLAADVGPYEFRVFDGDGKVRIVRSSGRRVYEDGKLVGLAGVLIDLTAHRSTEEQLRLAQKMEAVGRLAGGVAHDFNNLLTVINSYAGLAARGLGPDDPRRGELAEIRKAGDRAAALTRQLLAYGRKQVLKPEVLDVGVLAAGIERMLVRVIGEDVELRVTTSPGTGHIRADPGQVDQVLMNLAVNARDAMPEGGRLLIESENAELDEDFVSTHRGAQPGAFVRIRVTDTGCGMDSATRERLFEPFFTTKAVGKGTGLGLATVYGIVKQSGGSIWVTSEPGHGAVFDVYFPRVGEEASPAVHPQAVTRDRDGSATVLFVEDDEAVRGLAVHVLSAEGYDVLSAATGGEALLLAERRKGSIDLVVTDVVMPGMSGTELAAKLRPLLRDAPILFVSGYSDDAISRHGVLAPGTLFLAKPFTPETLLAKVREILEQAR